MPPKSKTTLPTTLLTPDQIKEIISSYPPLTENEFRYSLINMSVKAPDPKDPSIMLVSPIKTNEKYSLLSSMTHKCYIRHRIPQISNQAPTIEQWFQELRVYPEELNMPDNIPHSITKTAKANLMQYEPLDIFFSNANTNFASSKNARGKKIKGHFIYYYYIDPETNKVMHLDEPEARQLYCKKYEQSIMFEKSPARPVFEQLWKSCMSRSRDIPVVFRGYCVDNILDKPTRIADRYHDYRVSFSCVYCLAEMILKFPHLEKCIWNTEVPPKTTPRKRMFHQRPTIIYNNPHIGKIYDCDKGTVDQHLSKDLESFVSDEDD